MTLTHDTALETRRQAIQAEIDSRKSQAERNRLGQFATPIGLAVDIAGYVKLLMGPSRHPISFADPAVGSGSFFSAALSAFGHKRIKRAVGVELDAAFAGAASELWSDAGLDVVQADFTRIVTKGGCPAAPNVVLANPPYVRHHHLTRADKERLQQAVLEMTRVRVSGLAGLYVYFLLLATAWMSEDGYAAWLIPSEFMDVNYGAALKHFLTNRVTLIRVHRFDPDDVQFGDALVSSVVLVFRKRPPVVGHRVQFTLGGTLTQPHSGDMIPVDRLREARKWTVYPRHPKNDRHLSNNGDRPTLGDFFRVQRGIATGCNKFFVLERADARHRGLPEECLRPILPSPRNLATTVVYAGDDGYPELDRQLCVIDCDLSEPVIESRYPALWKYLQTADAAGIRDGYLVRKRVPWYRQEQREPAPFLCTYMGRGSENKQPFRFVWNRSSAIGTNLYLMLYPVGGLAAMLRARPERAEIVHELLGAVTGHELRGEGRVYGGGLNKIEPRELARVCATPFVERWPELAATIRRIEAPLLFA
ncbi:MAG: Eco57I restriction-modification methylase domain-containing protein [Phycisphaerae bacterium]|nr:Eco57I restriction-modification methylase domain-containing protein [Phycisphaerae bacterium]